MNSIRANSHRNYSGSWACCYHRCRCRTWRSRRWTWCTIDNSTAAIVLLDPASTTATLTFGQAVAQMVSLMAFVGNTCHSIDTCTCTVCIARLGCACDVRAAPVVYNATLVNSWAVCPFAEASAVRFFDCPNLRVLLIVFRQMDSPACVSQIPFVMILLWLCEVIIVTTCPHQKPLLLWVVSCLKWDRVTLHKGSLNNWDMLELTQNNFVTGANLHNSLGGICVDLICVACQKRNSEMIFTAVRPNNFSGYIARLRICQQIPLG
mmetsp:Transcript_89976/g.140644  ORF Transcript_89976/g.140644 Transcript_89976/m.140644 type:complete len:264 (-) Transcript_89976:953-1744(-)